MKQRAWAAGLVIVALANAMVLSLNVPRGDDITYLAWAVERLDTAWSPTLRPPPFPGWRPVTAAWWWLGCGLTSVSGAAQQAALAGLWIAALGTWTWWSWRRGGATAGLTTATLLLATDRFRDLVTWRSWLTSTSELAFGGACLLALSGGRRGVAVVAAVLAVWSKEPAALWLSAAAWVFHRDGRVAGAALLAGIPGGLRFASEFADTMHLDADLLARGWFYLRATVALGWPVVAVFVLLVRRRVGALGVVAAALALPVVYPVFNATYLVEATCVLAVGVTEFAGTAARRALLASALAGLAFGLPGSVSNARYQAVHQRDMQAVWSRLAAAPPVAYTLSDGANDDARWLALRLRWELDAAPSAIPLSAGPVAGLLVDP